MEQGRLQKIFLANRKLKKKGLIVFVNAGDPDLCTTKQIIKILQYNKVDAVELCVPFPNSFTDGEVILRSHTRALAHNKTFYDVLGMIADLRTTCDIPIVLLADFSHTVRPIGLEEFIKACKWVGVDGTMIHCLPPLLADEYSSLSSEWDLETIFSLYPKTSPEKRREIYNKTRGFIYLVTTYGKTGKSKKLSNEVLSFLQTVREETSLPLAVGFGIKTNEHVKQLYHAGTDAVIIGSAITSIIETNLDTMERAAHLGMFSPYLQLKSRERNNIFKAGAVDDMLNDINLFIQDLYFRYWFNSGVNT